MDLGISTFKRGDSLFNYSADVAEKITKSKRSDKLCALIYDMAAQPKLDEIDAARTAIKSIIQRADNAYNNEAQIAAAVFSELKDLIDMGY